MRSLPPLDDDLAPAEVIAALAPVLDPARAAKLDAVASARLHGVTVVIEDLLDPHNYGAVLRSVEAMGLLAVHTINARNRFRVSPRVTQNCERWLDLRRFTDADACVAALHKSGFAVLAAVPGAPLGASDVESRFAGRPVALAFGNEHLGLSPRLRALADAEFAVSMYGASQSLNVSVSLGMALVTVVEARRRALREATGRDGDLDAQAIDRLRARYYAGDVRNYRMLVERWRRETRATSS
jgi:tRNA (guanosine-2'-O-)-methyltransferase